MDQSAFPTKEELRQLALDRGADLCGFVSTSRLNEVTPTKFTPARLWPAGKTAISLGMHLPDGAAEPGSTQSASSPSLLARQTCEQLDRLALELAQLLERRGAQTMALTTGGTIDLELVTSGAFFAELSHRHVAVEAGLGVIGKSKLCLTPRFGPRIYFATLLTTAELEADPRLDWNPCEGCERCVEACPVAAIRPGRLTIRKPACLSRAIPPGTDGLRGWLARLLEMSRPEKERIDASGAPRRDPSQAVVLGAESYASCFDCLHACPIGKTPGEPAGLLRGSILQSSHHARGDVDMSDQDLFTARSTGHPTHTEWFLTGTPASGKPASEAARESFGQAAQALADGRIQVMQEKVYGLRTERAAILGARREAYGRRGVDASVPVTFLEGPPAEGGSFAGLQIWGVSPNKPGAKLVTTVERAGVAVGRRWVGPDYQLLALSSIDGRGPDGALRDCPSCQASQMLENAAAALAEHQLTFRDVPRTWIYLSRLLDWYGELNRVRTAHYGRVGLSASEGSIFPASTGIQARSDREECLMDVLAVQARPGSSLAVKPVVRTRRQDQAFSYGSAFSRAVVLESHGHKTVFISGTASIDSQGRTTHVGDYEAQAEDTLLAIAAILEEQGGGLEHLCQATIFCKDMAALEAYRSVSRRLRLPVPGVTVIADVCRPDLLIEIEAVAMI